MTDKYVDHDFLLTVFPDYTEGKDNTKKDSWKYMAFQEGRFLLVRQWDSNIKRWVVGVMTPQNFQRHKGYFLKDSKGSD